MPREKRKPPQASPAVENPQRPAKRRGRPVDEGLDRHVAVIAREMVRGRWRVGLSHQKYAHKWHKPIRYVYDRATEAGRFIRLSIGNDREALIGCILAELESLCTEAREGGKWGDAVRGIELRCRLLRLDVPPPQEPSSATGPRNAAEVLAYIRALVPDLESQILDHSSPPALPALHVVEGIGESDS